ncbi:MAG: PP2C family protein-serine/threonine phosphatase [Solidesulfovibrio sp. DCME]|uniref:PP2C family protein-serine/threonine phosphatase n=1 Tax=Solidesulfovibrio sp. DCME TaxID=3447380 RepID=UPI003D0C236B
MTASACAEAPRLAERLQALTRCFALSRLVTESLELSEVLERIMTTSRQALGAEASSLLLVDEAPGPGQGQLVFTVAQGPASRDLRSGFRLAPGEGVAGWVAKEARPVLLVDAYADPRFNRDVDRLTGYRTRSMACVPLSYRGRVIGVAQCINKEGGGVFTEDDIEIFSLLAAQAAVAIVNARLHREALVKQRMDFDMELAAGVQQSLLPRAAPPLPGIDVAGLSLSCDATGGDYYDFLPRGDAAAGTATLLAVIGDVTGHGVQAALLMTTVRAFLRARLLSPGAPADIVGDVNRLLARDMGDSGRFMTLFLLEIGRGSREARYVRAGHDPALLYDPRSGAFTELSGRGIPLGIDADWRYEDNVVPALAPGAVLVLATDGIWEARGPSGEMYGKDRLRRAVRRAAGCDAAGLARAVLADLDGFLAGEPRHDDVTLVVIKASAGAGEKEDA